MPDTPRLPEQPPQPGSSLPEHAASPNGQAPLPPAAVPRQHHKHGWIWYFVALLVLSLLATGIIIAYNWSQQLTPERLEKARKLWDAKGPKDYEYRYTKRAGENQVDHFHVVVRGGAVRSVTLNNVIEIPKAQFVYYGMPALFDQIERFLELDAGPDRPKVFKVASFAPEDGHLRRYVRRVMGTRERVEILVEGFKRLGGK